MQIFIILAQKLPPQIKNHLYEIWNVTFVLMQMKYIVCLSESKIYHILCFSLLEAMTMTQTTAADHETTTADDAPDRAATAPTTAGDDETN